MYNYDRTKVARKVHLTPTQLHLLAYIAVSNSRGVSPKLPPIVDNTLNILEKRGLVRSIAGFSDLTEEGMLQYKNEGEPKVKGPFDRTK